MFVAQVPKIQIDHRMALIIPGEPEFLLLPEHLRQLVSSPELHTFIASFAEWRFRAKSIVLQLAITLFVQQNSAFAATGFCNQNAASG